jgi:hypothetical protein
LLTHAGAHADIVGLQGLGRTKPDGHSHEVRWGAAHLDTQLAQVRAGAGERFDAIEFSALVQVVQVTDDRNAVLEKICGQVEGLSIEDAMVTPYLLVGTPDEIVLHMATSNERWGINYFVVRELDDFEPVLSVLR